MPTLDPYRRALRFICAWQTGRANVSEVEVYGKSGRSSDQVPVTVFRPRMASGPLAAGPMPGWVVLHGVAVAGRHHPRLVRFARALASSGAVVAVPEVPEWSSFELAPEATLPAIVTGLDVLESVGVGGGRCAVAGFSFAAPHAVAASSDDRVRSRVRGVVGFGGYCSLATTLDFMFSGRHGYKGDFYSTLPDPYGRWIVAANFITLAPEHRDAHDVADRLRSLAGRAGRVGEPGWSPVYEPYKSQLRAEIAPERRLIFDLIAPPGGGKPEIEPAKELAKCLYAAAQVHLPSMDPSSALATASVPVHLIHGRHDHLIPFTETLRLRDLIDPDTEVRTTITGLFAHSTQERWGSAPRAVREMARFAKALAGALSVTDNVT